MCGFMNFQLNAWLTLKKIEIKHVLRKLNLITNIVKIYFFLTAYPSFIAVEFKHGAHP